MQLKIWKKGHWVCGFILSAAMLLGFSSARADVVDFPDVEVVGVIGDSFQNGLPPEGPPLYSVRYLGGLYKTWVDHAAAITDRSHHWLNYAEAGAVSAGGDAQLQRLLSQAVWPDANGNINHYVDALVIGVPVNDFSWAGFNQAIVDQMITNIQQQIATAKAAGIEKVILLGMPQSKDVDLGRFLLAFPLLPTHISSAGWDNVRWQYYNAFAGLSQDYLFVDTWCNYETVDGLHPNYTTSTQAASKIVAAVNTYEQRVGKRNMLACY